MRFSRLTHLPMFLSLEALTSIIRTGLPVLVELIDLVNSAIILLSQMTLLRWLTFLLASQTVILIALLFWIYFFHLSLYLFYNAFPSIGKFWSCCCLSFHWLSIQFTTGCPISSHSLWLFSCWLRFFVIIWEMFNGRISLNSVLLLLRVTFVSEFRLELMYISVTENIRSSLTYLHGFQLLVLLP